MEFLNFKIYALNDNVTVTVGSLIFVLLGYIFAKLVNYLVRKVLKAYFKKRAVDVGRSYTILQLVKYLIYVIIFVATLNTIGLRLNYLLAGSAALLVGVGLGLQQTINDFFSGIILLVDGTLEVGDILSIDGELGKVKFIGLRTSKIENRDKHLLIIPNSKLINNKVDNLSQLNNPIRFHINVGVSYKSDIKHVEEVLLRVVKDFTNFKMNYSPSVHLVSYGDFSVDFCLYFYSKEVFLIDKVLSDLRKEIFHAFQEEGIEIPFPQRDVWIKEETANKLV